MVDRFGIADRLRLDLRVGDLRRRPAASGSIRACSVVYALRGGRRAEGRFRAENGRAAKHKVVPSELGKGPEGGRENLRDPEFVSSSRGGGARSA